MTTTDERSLTIARLEVPRPVGPRSWPRAALPAARGPRAILALVCVLIAATGVAKLIDIRHDALPADAVFRLDGTVVTEQQLDERAALVSFLYGVTKPDAPADLDKFNRALAKAVAVSMIVGKVATDHDIVIADKVAADKLQQMITDSGTSRRTFIQQLGSRGLSEGDILDEIKFEQANSQLFTLVTKNIEPTTDAAARSYFLAHSKELATPEYRTLLNIVVPSKRQAEHVTRLARRGVPFGQLVARYSIDESTRGKGGSLGTLTSDQLETGYATAAFAAPKGGFFGPVQTPQGWNVGRVTAVEASKPARYEDIKDALKARLSYDAKLTAWNTFLADQVKAADLTYADDYRPADPDQLPGQAVGQTSPNAR